MCVGSSSTEVLPVFQTRSEHHPLLYHASFHTVLSASAASGHVHTDQPTASVSSQTSQRHVPIPISETPSTQIFDNTLVDLPAPPASGPASQRRQTETVERHWLPKLVKSLRRKDMLDYFAVRRPQVKWKPPVRLPPTNSERCLKSSVVYQSRSQMTQLAASAHVVSCTAHIPLSLIHI